MANITITTEPTKIHLNLGNYAPSPDINTEKVTYPKTAVLQVSKPYQLPYLLINTAAGTSVVKWQITNQFDQQYPTALVVDSIDGVAPTSLDNLYDLLTDIMS
jgi:hypothetical protein